MTETDNLQQVPTPDEQKLIWEFRGQEPHGVALRLRKSHTVRPSFVAEQVGGWNRLAVKVPMWAEHDGLYFPFPVAIQQCSSEAVARWRAGLVGGGSLLDLTGGLGVDCFFMGRNAESVTYVDADARAVAAAQNNFSRLGVTNTSFVCSTAEDFLTTSNAHYDTIFIDPSRRSNDGGRVFRVADCSPDVEKWAGRMLELADVVIIKLSPLLDVSLLVGQLPSVADVYALGAGGECKDLVVRLMRGCVGEPRLHAVSVSDGGEGEDFAFTKREEEEAEPCVADAIADYLFEPSPQFMKMSPFKLLGQRYGVRALSSSTHIFTNSADVPYFPGRRFRVEAVYENGKKGFAALKKATDRAAIAVRNFPISAEALRAKLKMKEDDSSFVFGVTLKSGEQKLVLCRRLG